MPTPHVPIIDISALHAVDARQGDRAAIAAQIGAACRQHGFFYVTGHGVSAHLTERLMQQSRHFFAQPLEKKLAIAMVHGGRAWRGYFPPGSELTSGAPDQKEGLYLGTELSREDPLVRAGTPLHGPNLFPDDLPLLRQAALAYMAEMTGLGHRLMASIALSLGLPESYFAQRYTAEPLTLFRIFNYPRAAGAAAGWGVGEHTDYGLLTLLLQDETGGLEIKTGSQWLTAPPIPGTLVCNIGDMLERMTGGRYRSTPHRVRNLAPRDRLSFPFFFDPGWSAQMGLIDLGDLGEAPPDAEPRWDGADVHAVSGTYGDYLLRKIARVFPALHDAVL